MEILAIEWGSLKIWWRTFRGKRLNALCLVAALIACTVLWLAYPHQFNASDPWYYSQRAYDFTRHGQFGHVFDGLVQTFDFRLSVYVPVALFYRIFGIGILTTHLYSLAAERTFLYAAEQRAKFLSGAYGDNVFTQAFRRAGASPLYRRAAATLYVTERNYDLPDLTPDPK